ncbi:MAG: hypothetical protein M1826_003566 [Phylliscum demangeonii]|nr:MAG: hypothetical protein M1826_003566 [Phylliscum demangeonii]
MPSAFNITEQLKLVHRLRQLVSRHEHLQCRFAERDRPRRAHYASDARSYRKNFFGSDHASSTPQEPAPALPQRATRSTSSRSLQDLVNSSSDEWRTTASQLQRPPWPKPAFHAASRNNTTGSRRHTILIDGQLESFDVLFLRDACSCEQCVDAHSGQKLFRTADIPSNIDVGHSSVTSQGGVRITWTRDVPGWPTSHQTELTPNFLRTYRDKRSRVRSRWNDVATVLWDRGIIETDLRRLDYGEYMTSDERLFEALQALTRYGLVFLEGVPDDERAVEKIASRIGPLKDTFYGRMWDLRSVPNATNVAYTNRPLSPHMDLLYFAEPPALQLLHCLRNNAHGGETVFADAFRAATQLRLDQEVLFRTLLHYPVTYHYWHGGGDSDRDRDSENPSSSTSTSTSSANSQHYHHAHTTIELDPHPYQSTRPKLHAVNWSPAFQAPFETDVHTDEASYNLRRYHAAAQAFARLLEAPTALFEHRMRPGECVLFHNRRVVHGRRAFELDDAGEQPPLKTGEKKRERERERDRWFKGGYVDSDPFWSRWRVLSERFKRPAGAPPGAGGAGTGGGGGAAALGVARGGRFGGDDDGGGDEYIR